MGQSVDFALPVSHESERRLPVNTSWVETLNEKSWLLVNPEENGQLSLVNCELFIAVRGSAGLVGIMGLGGKLSEEPYSKEDRELLMTVAREMGLALENAELLEVAKREAEMSRDLEIARHVQQNLFPKQLPCVKGWEFAGICKPAKAVGGDYYDIFEAVPGRVVVALGDVSGKGLGASFVMSGVHSTIRTNAEKSIENPVGLINELNKYLLGSTSKNTFVTLFLGIIDTETDQLKYVNAGHQPAFVVRRENGGIEKLTRTGLGLGMVNTTPFNQGSSYLNEGDSLIVYSDGVTEAMDEKEEMFDEVRLLPVLEFSRNLEANQLIKRITDDVMTFTGTREQADDISVVVAKHTNFLQV
jgi:sigma-B regulation protein RsbU (phosphoserine phosphatase)